MFFEEPIIFDRVDYPMSSYYGDCDQTSEYSWPISPSERSESDYGFDMSSPSRFSPPMCQADNFSGPIPTASVATATASIQSAFCKKPKLPNMSTTSPNQQIKSEIFDNEYHSPNNNSYPYSQAFAENLSINSEASDALDEGQLDIYRDLILRHLVQDITTTCAKVGLPTDPNHWTNEHCWKWIKEMCQQFSHPIPKPCFLTGALLLQMSQRDFEQFAQSGAADLHAQLQLWKTAFEAYQQHQPAASNGNYGISNSNSMSAAIPKEWPSTSKMPTAQSPAAREPFQLFPNLEGMNGFYGCSPFQSPTLAPDAGFFGNDTMPSPSNSELSSPGSDAELDDEADLPFGLFPSGGFPDAAAASGGAYRSSGTVHLWHFIRELLDQPKQYSHCVRWVNRDEGTFKIESSHALANTTKKGIIQKPEKKQRLVYKFLPPYNL
ncbi:unnamed protein product, partial [Mesorhabditis spiculigera]